MFRCEDCLPLVEEYFDGEVEARLSEQMSAHISSCADCAAALDALSFESEIFARYERGLEPTPALWARVSAEISREAVCETRAPQKSFPSRAARRLLAAFGVLSLRPALASSFALLVIGATAGSLWLAHRPGHVTLPVASKAQVEPPVARTSPPFALPGAVKVEAPNNVNSTSVGVEFAKAFGPRRLKAGATHAPQTPAKDQGLTDDDIKSLLGDGQQALASNAGTTHDAGGHDDPNEIAGLLDAPKPYVGFINASSQLPDASDKEMARHVEQTQMLLRSIKNARASGEGGTINVAYEKKLSRQLLADNATLKLEAEVNGDKGTKQVLDTIEPFLLDIANMREQSSREDLRSIRERVKKTEIIASLQVY